MKNEIVVFSKHDTQENPAEWNARYFNQSWPASNILYDVRMRVLHLHIWKNSRLFSEAVDEAVYTIENLMAEVR